ncbi:MAG: hypothetical protein IJK60_09405 [Clostridia bacterium]|nr:hypothetical protein [Clostridia bacterium]
MKKTISVLLCLCIMFCMCGTSAFALGGETADAGATEIKEVRIEGFTFPEPGKTLSSAESLTVICEGADNAEVDLTVKCFELDGDGNRTNNPETFKEGCVYNFNFTLKTVSDNFFFSENAKLYIQNDEVNTAIYSDGKEAYGEVTYYCTSGDFYVRGFVDYGGIFIKAYVKEQTAFLSDLFGYVTHYNFFPNGFGINEIINIHSKFFLFLADVLMFIAEYDGDPFGEMLYMAFLSIAVHSA